MRDRLRALLRVDYLPLWVVVATSLLALILKLVGRADINLLMAFVIILLDIIVIGIVVQRVVFLDRIEGSVTMSLERIERSVATIRAGWPLSDIEAFHSSRKSLPGVPELLQGATEEFFVVGISLGMVVGAYAGQLASKAQDGCRVRLLMMSPFLEDGSPNPLVAEVRHYHGWAAADRTLLANIEEVVARQDLELRVYFDLPCLAIVFIDAALPRGRAVVELLPYRFDPSERPSFEISASRSEELLSRLYGRYQKMWEAAKPWPPTQLELTFLGKLDDQVGPGPSQLGPDGHMDAVLLLKVGPWRHRRVITQIDLLRTDDEGNPLSEHWTSSAHARVWQLGVAAVRGETKEDVTHKRLVVRAHEELQFLLYASDTVRPGEWFSEGQWYEVLVHHEAATCTARTCLAGP